MAIGHLDTSRFSEAELAAQAAARQVDDIRLKVKECRNGVEAVWTGEGRGAFDRLFAVVERQAEDISQEFWNLYEAMCNAEADYLEADQAVATALESAAGGA